MNGAIYAGIGLFFTVIGGGFAWLFRRYRAASEEKASLAIQVETLEKRLATLREIADAQSNPITDVERANRIVQERRKDRD